MKRDKVIARMINEGFSTETLSKMTDKQLSLVASRVLSESDIMISKKDPMATQKITDAKKQNKTIETYESKDEVPVTKNPVGKKKSSKKSQPFATKGEVMEMIQSKVKKGHNGIPEFMTYDSIKSADVKGDEAPAKTKTVPRTKPGVPKTSPGEKPYNPYQPGPGTNPSPKGMGKK